MLWRIHVEPDDVANLRDELWVVGDFERARDVRLQAERSPYAPDRRVAQSDGGGHASRAPMRTSLWFRLERLDDDSLDVIVRDGSWRSHSRLVIESIEPLLRETLAPLPDSLIRRAELGGDFRVSVLDAPQHDPRAKRETAVHARSLREAHQLVALLVGEHEWCRWSSRSFLAHCHDRSRREKYRKRFRFQGTSTRVLVGLTASTAGRAFSPEVAACVLSRA